MAKTTAKLTVVNPKAKPSIEEQKRVWELEEDQVRLTPGLVKVQVAEIRSYLEQCDATIGALHFDIITTNPWSIEYRDDDMESNMLVDRLNPIAACRYNRVKQFLDDVGQEVFCEHNLAQVKWALCDMSFAIGVLAGAIFSGAAPKEIDRFERGLCQAITLRPREIKTP